MYMNASNALQVSVQREPRVVGGGSYINVGAWVRPRAVDWDGFAEATNISGWTKERFEPHFRKAERMLHVHRDPRTAWNKASVLYEQAAKAMGIPVFENASNRFNPSVPKQKSTTADAASNAIPPPTCFCRRAERSRPTRARRTITRASTTGSFRR